SANDIGRKNRGKDQEFHGLRFLSGRLGLQNAGGDAYGDHIIRHVQVHQHGIGAYPGIFTDTQGAENLCAGVNGGSVFDADVFDIRRPVTTNGYALQDSNITPNGCPAADDDARGMRQIQAWANACAGRDVACGPDAAYHPDNTAQEATDDG